MLCTLVLFVHLANLEHFLCTLCVLYVYVIIICDYLRKIQPSLHKYMYIIIYKFQIIVLTSENNTSLMSRFAFLKGAFLTLQNLSWASGGMAESVVTWWSIPITHTHSCTHAHTPSHMRINACTCIHIHICTQMNMHTHSGTRMHKSIYTCVHR